MSLDASERMGGCGGFMCGEGAELLSRRGDCAICRVSGPGGEAVMTGCHVFPGIDIIYNEVNMREYRVSGTSPDGLIEINHCREGCFERECDGEYLCLSQGDMSVHLTGRIGGDFFFPLGHYRGVSVIIDPERAARCLCCMLDGVSVDPREIVNKFCSGVPCHVMRSAPSIEHIFGELYSVPDEIRAGYFKVKVLELLLCLSAAKPESAREGARRVPRSRAELAKAAAAYVAARTGEKITVPALAAVFGVSQTMLKVSFREVYGVSVYAFVRSLKMRAAAFILKNTGKSVLEVAGEVGYDNGSKFAKAFRDVVGVRPREYRRGSEAAGAVGCVAPPRRSA